MQLKDLEKCSTSNLMQTEKIVNITGPGEPYESQFGTLYPFVIQFESGLLGKANSKSQRYPMAIGSVVGVEINGQTPDGYAKIKVHKTPPPPMAAPQAWGNRPPPPIALPPHQAVPATPAPLPAPPAPQPPTRPAFEPQAVGMALKLAGDVLIRNSYANKDGVVDLPNLARNLKAIAESVLEAGRAIQNGTEIEQEPF